MNRSGAFVLSGLLCAALCFAARPGVAQSAIVAVEEENFRSEPRGSIIAELVEGTRLVLGEAQGQWREATLEAWIWGPSVQEQRRGDHDLIVNAGGENLRLEPNGRRLGVAMAGMRLERLGTEGRWLRVRRTGWIWSPSVRTVAEPTLARPTATPDAATDGPPAVPSRAETGAPSPAPQREYAVASGGSSILDSPTGQAMARLEPGARVEILSREGDWSRVRIEGWTFTGSLAAGDSAAESLLVDLPRDSLVVDPERFRGRRVEWTLQFIALQEAERFRTEFVEGEPFMLARGPGDDPGFVYVAVPPERLDQVKRLAPLQRLRIIGRVRIARSALTGAPVLDLVEITGH